MNDELKPCPFCGGRAELDSRKNIGHDLPEWWAKCKTETCNAIGPKCTGPESANIIWNRRPEPPRREAEQMVIEALAALTDPEDRFNSAINEGPERDELQAAWNEMLALTPAKGKEK